MPLLLVGLLAWPLLEIALFVKVGGAIGVPALLALILGTGALGVAVLRRAGARTRGDVGRALREMRDPGSSVAQGALRLLAGGLLLLPGLAGDAVGLALLLPGVRAGVAGLLARRVRRHVSARMQPQPHRPGRGMIIDGEFVEVEPAPGPRVQGPPSGWTRG